MFPLYYENHLMVDSHIVLQPFIRLNGKHDMAASHRNLYKSTLVKM